MNRWNRNKISILCGIAMLLCGLVILGICVFCGGSTYTYISATLFIAIGALYVSIGCRQKG